MLLNGMSMIDVYGLVLRHMYMHMHMHMYMCMAQRSTDFRIG